MAGLTLKTRVFAAVKANNLDKRYAVKSCTCIQPSALNLTRYSVRISVHSITAEKNPSNRSRTMKKVLILAEIQDLKLLKREMFG